MDRLEKKYHTEVSSEPLIKKRKEKKKTLSRSLSKSVTCLDSMHSGIKRFHLLSMTREIRTKQSSMHREIHSNVAKTKTESFHLRLTLKFDKIQYYSIKTVWNSD